jgi:hypothetical protein
MSGKEVFIEEIELVLEPIPPDTTDSIMAEFEAVVRMALGKAGQEDLLDSEQIIVQIERTFPTDAVATALLTLAGGIALKAFEVTLLPEIEKRYRTWVKSRRKRRKHSRK